MISVLIPTRGRPDNLARTAKSIRSTVTRYVEVCCYVDEDDINTMNRASEIGVNFTVRPRICMSEMWTALVPIATGNILMLGSDDIIFRTDGWDEIVEQAFAGYPDRILMAFGDDGSEFGKSFGTLPFVSREWVNAVGYFTPPGYSGDCADDHLNDVAKMIGRHKYIPILIEHLHPVWGKAPMDPTYQEKLDRQGDARKLYNSRESERIADAEKLRKVMRGH